MIGYYVPDKVYTKYPIINIYIQHNNIHHKVMYIFNLADLNGVTSDKIINNRNNIYSHEFIICYVDYYKKNIQII